MRNLILFADDDVFNNGFESNLYGELRDKYPVVAAHNLDLAKKALQSINSLTALIIDWEFIDKEIGEGLEKPPDTPLDLLLDQKFEQKIFSLVYIYSRNDVENSKDGKKLKKVYKDRIIFRKKDLEDGNDAQEILKVIKDWNDKNINLYIPEIWMRSINNSSQKIFSELSKADPQWIAEVFRTAKEDGANPEIFVIEMFQNLLSEALVLEEPLLEEIRKINDESKPIENEVSLAMLYKRIVYTKLIPDSIIMTGDIVKLKKDTFGILLTPECDINDRIKDDTLEFEVIPVKMDSFDKYLETKKSYKKTNFNDLKNGGSNKKDQLKKLRQIFNNGEIKLHFLPLFPFKDDVKQTALIDFSHNILHIPSKKFKKLKRSYKINSPYIQQIRQRYLAYKGRVGVSSYPETLRDYSLKH